MSQTFEPNAILFIHQAHPSMRRRRYLRRLRAWMRALALLIILCLVYPAPAISGTLRLASYTAALERKAPGLLRDKGGFCYCRACRSTQKIAKITAKSVGQMCQKREVQTRQKLPKCKG